MALSLRSSARSTGPVATSKFQLPPLAALQVSSLPAVHPRAHLVVHLKGTAMDVGAHTVHFRWLNPHGNELWSSAGDLNVGAPPPGVAEMDLPLIAQIDLSMDSAGRYMLAIAIDGNPTVDVPVQVRTAGQMTGAGAAPGKPLLS